ncbi:MAG: L-ribulose-5-phosphate 4-epimerase [Clostridiales bacterium]|jgi:L-ribulose-5-phosphate 4-epimerase|nr:L-ribulose-5-phosphate 4-epimerase [Clostridiales bacterium]
MLDGLKQAVFEANLLLPRHDLVTLTWGNASGIDRVKGIIVIKPSGVDYADMKASDMVAVDIETGKAVPGSLKPSSDTPTHLELYRGFTEIGGIVHTHSRWATIMAQAGHSVPALGTTHADYFYGEIPVTRKLMADEIRLDYEARTGTAIIQAFAEIPPMDVPAVLVAGHGPFTWGISPFEAAHNAIVLEEVCFMAWHVMVMNCDIKPMQKELLDKHYMRKHGKDAYYGQG